MGPVLPIVAVAATVVGAGISAVSSIQQGKAAKQQANYQAQIAEMNQQQALKNAQLSTLNAGYAEDAAAKKADDEARQIRAMAGAQRASLAANGLLVDEGSGAELVAATQGLGAARIAETRRGGARTATGYRIQAENSVLDAGAADMRADAYRASGKAAQTAGILGAAGSIIGGASKVAGQYSDMSRSGVAMTPPAIFA